jgi:hypothetical protein
MEKKNWTDWDKIVWGSVLAVAEGVIVYQIIGLKGTCNLLNITILPCWGWALVVWIISALATYYILVRGALWLFPKLWGKVKRYYYQYKNGRNAKIIVVPVCVKDEYFVAIRNDEFWLRANGVIVNSKVITPDNRKINKNMKWLESDSKNDATSISRKKHKSLHIATISNDELMVHFINGDEIFPFPNKVNSYYVLPLYITGSMSFFGYRVRRVTVRSGNEVLIYNNGEIKVR